MRNRMIVVLACGVFLGCGGAAEQADSAPADTVSQGARDSAIAGSRLPGAAAVGRALDVSEAAQERAAQMDSIQ